MEAIEVEQETGEDIVIECPECDFWENAPEDIPRRKLDVVSSVSDDGRYTDCQCPICQHKWRLDWNNAL